MFNPDYVPDIVDLMLCHDKYYEHLNGEAPESRYCRLKGLGLDFRFRFMLEDVAMSVLTGDIYDYIATLGKDTILLIHGREDCRGLKAAKKISEITPARIIVMYGNDLGSTYYDRMKEIFGIPSSEFLPFTPKSQVSFGERFSLWESYLSGEGHLEKYLQELVALRGVKNV